FLPALLSHPEFGSCCHCVLDTESALTKKMDTGFHRYDKHSEWLKFCQNLKKRYSFYNTETYLHKGKALNPYYFVRKLSEAMKENSVMVAANGSACVCMFQAGEIKKGQRVFWNSGDASMGYDLPASIGACIASGQKDTICLAGDGSIMMNLQELQTIKHYDLPIKIFILNNDGYVSIRQTQTNFFNGCLTGACPNSGVTMPDFAKTAKSFGLKSETLKTPENLKKRIDAILKTEGPVVVDVRVKRDYIFTPKLSSRKLKDGTMVSPTLEDMYPFLDRKEYEENILQRCMKK
ncbi:MAG: thiamine pyrophosphate-dependent enzyme, partial [Endomicrobia bacterium]|nr:thiamine pyrophosphate-dependent enzyme [Endomicrobiia bacterium]